MGEYRKARVLIIDNSVKVSGAYRSIIASIQMLEDKLETFFAVPKGIWDTAPLPKNKIYWFQYLEIHKGWKVINYLPRLLANTIRASKIISTNDITVVHVNDIYNMMGVLLKLFHPRVRLVYHVRLLRSSYAKPVYGVWRFLVRRFADRIICVSRSVLHDIGEGDNVKVIYDALPGAWQLNERYQMPATSEVKALYIGNYIQGKGQDHALDAISQAIKEVPSLRLKFLGDLTGSGDSKAFLHRLESKTAEYNLERYVTFAGYSDQVQREILDSHFVINFSESESFSMTCLESLACRRPIIVTNCGGPEEIVQDGVNGLIIPNRSVPHMTKALVKMASDADLRSRFSKNALIDFHTKFNIELLSEQLRITYTE